MTGEPLNLGNYMTDDSQVREFVGGAERASAAGAVGSRVGGGHVVIVLDRHDAGDRHGSPCWWCWCEALDSTHPDTQGGTVARASLIAIRAGQALGRVSKVVPPVRTTPGRRVVTTE